MTAFFFLNDLRFKPILPVYLKKYNWSQTHLFFSIFLIVYLGFSEGIGAQSRIDSLKAVIAQQEVDISADPWLNLFIEYRLVDIDSAIYFANTSGNIARQQGDSLLYIRAEYALGWAYGRKGLLDLAIKHYLKSVTSARNNGFEDREKAALNGLATSYYYNSQYDLALEYHFESLSLREKGGDKREIAIANNNIGLVYFQIRDFDEAIQYFETALRLDNETGLRNQEETLANLGLCFSSIGKYDEALEQFDMVLEQCQGNCDPSLLIEVYNGGGIVYQKLGNNILAEDYFEKAKEISVRENLKPQLVISLHNLANLWITRLEYQKAEGFLKQSQNIALEIEYRLFVNLNYKSFAEVYSKLDDYQLAFQYQSKYDSLNSTILNEELIKNLAQTQAKRQERDNLEKISEQEDTIERTTTLIYLSVLIIALVSAIGFILWRNNRTRRRVNHQLSQANDTIERQNRELVDVNNMLEEKVKERTKELKEANAALIKSNTDLDTFIYKTSHDIRGPLATLQGMCNVALIDIEDTKALDYFQKLGKTADRLNEILSKLLVINQINNSIICIEEVNINEMVDDVVNESKLLSNGDQLMVKKNIDDRLIFGSDKDLIKIIFNNVVNNAFKFYNSSDRIQSFVEINAHRNGKAVKISVIDNGIGIDEKGADKIFEIFSKASEVADSAGLGLYLVKLAIEKLEGDIFLSRTSEGYTEFNVTLPLV